MGTIREYWKRRIDGEQRTDARFSPVGSWPEIPGLAQLDKRTQSTRRGIPDSVCDETISDTDKTHIGSLPFDGLSVQAIAKLRDRKMPGAGDQRLKVLRRLFDILERRRAGKQLRGGHIPEESAQQHKRRPSLSAYLFCFMRLSSARLRHADITAAKSSAEYS